MCIIPTTVHFDEVKDFINCAYATTNVVSDGELATPPLSTASSFESLEELKTPGDVTPAVVTPDKVNKGQGNAVFEDLDWDNFAKWLEVKDKWQDMTRKWTTTTPDALAFDEGFDEGRKSAQPAQRPGATPLFAPSFHKLNNGPRRSVYEGKPTQGDRGVWMSLKETAEYRKELAAAQRAKEWDEMVRICRGPSGEI